MNDLCNITSKRMISTIFEQHLLNQGYTSDKCMEKIKLLFNEEYDSLSDKYFRNIRSHKQIEMISAEIYNTITTEVQQITLDDCTNYIYQMVINRTFDGYTTEINTIYGQLSRALDVDIEPAPDKWDRLYNVDFSIEINNKFIGIQIKPVCDVSHISQIYKERNIQQRTHEKFLKKYGGNVFYIFSMAKAGKKEIVNPEVIIDIKQEIDRLRSEG